MRGRLGVPGGASPGRRGSGRGRGNWERAGGRRGRGRHNMLVYVNVEVGIASGEDSVNGYALVMYKCTSLSRVIDCG